MEGSFTAAATNGGAATVIAIAEDFVWTGFPESLAEMPNEKVPLTVGVPEMTPLVVASEIPLGSAPEVIFQV